MWPEVDNRFRYVVFDESNMLDEPKFSFYYTYYILYFYQRQNELISHLKSNNKETQTNNQEQHIRVEYVRQQSVRLFIAFLLLLLLL